MPETTKPETASVPTVKVPTVAPRKKWRLSVIDTAPFVHATLAGHTFHVFSEPIVEDPHVKGRMMRKHTVGLIEPLTDAEVGAIRAKIDRTYVRWFSKDARRAQIFEPSVLEPMNPETDEPIGKFLEMEAIED